MLRGDGKLTTLQGGELGLVREAQYLPGICPQEVYFQDGGGGGGGQHIPHGVVLRNGLSLAGKPDVPPVAHLWSLHTSSTSLHYASMMQLSLLRR